MNNRAIGTLLICGAALVARPAAAQPDDPIAHCRESTSGKSARIACLEAAIRGLTGAEIARGEARAPAKAASPAIADAEKTAVAEAKTAPAEPTGLGAEQVKEREVKKGERPREEMKSERVIATVTEFATTSLGDIIFFLDNGQIWRQKTSDRSQLRLSRKRQYTVFVEEGMLSGYRLTINELKRTILVERIK